MKKKVVIFLCFISFNVYAWNEKSIIIPGANIGKLQAHTTNHATSAAKNISVLSISGLDGGCTKGVYFNVTENSSALSLMLAAKMGVKDINVAYDIDQKSPWGDPGICALTSIRIE